MTNYYNFGKWLSLYIDTDLNGLPDCMKNDKEYCSVTFQFLWFELNWWAIGTAGYGAVEFRWNKYWC